MERKLKFKKRNISFLLILFVVGQSFSQTKPSLKIIPKPTFQLGSLFKDHMVLQRDVLIPVWGKTEKGSTDNIQ